ncbi:MAG TPA: J domain-containing protein [Rhodanobacteraceae bacterium]
MAGGTDFLLLYKELRLRPGCGLGEFRQAYRRRVAELHPDRVQHHLYEDAAARLSNLNAMYASAMEFHKQYGRLPGEASVYRPDPAARLHTPPPPSTSQPASAKRSSWVLTVLLVLAALVIGWILGAVEGDGGDDQSSTSPVPPVVFAAEAAATPVAKIARIRVGMESERVAEIEGEPVTTTKDRWEYGPSWIAFHCGEVLDWYSSPLRPLKVDSMQAPADEVEKESRLRIPGCLKAESADHS